MKKIAGYISPLQKFLASPPQNEIRAARPGRGGLNEALKMWLSIFSQTIRLESNFIF